MHDGRGGARRRDDDVLGRLRGENQRGRDEVETKGESEEVRGSRERARGSRGSARRLRGRPGGSGKQEVAGARAGVRRTHASHPSGAGWETTGRWAWWAATVPGRPGKHQVFSLSLCFC